MKLIDLRAPVRLHVALNQVVTALLTSVLFSLFLQVEWRDDLRRVLKQAGAQFQPTAFLFSDTQLKDESFLEDINNILNTGEVPNLFPKVSSSSSSPGPGQGNLEELLELSNFAVQGPVRAGASMDLG